MKCQIVAFSVVLFLSVIAACQGEQLIVNGDANIFGAGHTIPPAPGGGHSGPGSGGGELPPVFSFAAGSGQILTFSSVTGTVGWATWPRTISNGPDGGQGDADISSYGGLSGIVDHGRWFYLTGVFLNDSEPLDPAPSRLDFTNGWDFVDLSPQLNQVFFVGDGLTGTGAVQQFHVPNGATRLFLGFADGPSFQGAPGQYDDDTGLLTANFAVTPEPSGLALLGIAAISLQSYAWRRRRQSAWNIHPHLRQRT